MGRKLRICQPNLTYHIYSRCIDKANLMKNDNIKDLMIQVILETQEKFNFELNAFEILDNHFHFIIKTKKNSETISQIMHRIKSVFAKRYNKLHGRTGPFWNERFGCKIVESVGGARHQTNYFINLLWYLAYNSFRKGKVKDPREYRYSSINSYLKKSHKSRLKITVHQIFKNLGNNFKDRLDNFLYFENIYRHRLRVPGVDIF